MGQAASEGISEAIQLASDAQLNATLAAIPPTVRGRVQDRLEKLADTNGGGATCCDGLHDKESFVRFIIFATMSRSTPEFKELYSFLLHCFTEADTDFDGVVGPDEFDMMIERAGNLPRKFGLAPSTAELFPTPEARRTARLAMFKEMDTSGDGKIAFDECLEYFYKHICEKVKGLSLDDAHKKLGTFKAAGFATFLTEACRSKKTMEYKELYRFLLACFTSADGDRDGKIVEKEFDALIDIAAEEPRRLGYAPPAASTYASMDARLKTRREMFASMDTDKSGFIGFDEFLRFTYNHICEKVKAMPTNPQPNVLGAGNENKLVLELGSAYSRLPDDRQSFVKFLLTATSNRNSSEFTELYKFLLKCFIDADSDFDGLIGSEDFDIMIEQAGNLPRRFGFAPTSAEMFPNADARRKARGEMFRSMNKSGNGKITFDEWFSFSYAHICEKSKLASLDDNQWKLGSFGKNDFVKFIREACRSTSTSEYKELYHWLLNCFREGDEDRDGKVMREEFDLLIDITAEEPRRLGFAPSNADMFKSDEERKASRRKMFDSMDEDKSGYIGFEEFLKFTYDHIKMKVKTL